MREVDGRNLHTRIKAKSAIERSLRSLLIRVHRFARGRATTPIERVWSAQVIDAVTALLGPIDGKPQQPVDR